MSELTDKIRIGEGVQQDFKFRVDDKKKISRTLAAFANTEGGSLLIGVKDNGKISGVDPEEEYYMVEGAAEQYCQPPVKFTSKVWQEDRHLVLEIHVPKSDIRHKAINEDRRYATYYRIEDNTVTGNKILDKVWMYEKHGLQRPTVFNDITLHLISSIKTNEPVSLSRLYRDSELKKGDVDRLLASLIHWGIITYRLIEDRIYYYIRG